MRILQICPRVPWPPLDGGRVAMVQLTESLTRAGATVDVISLNQAKFRVDSADAVTAVDIDTSDYLGAALRMRRLRAPLLVSRFYSPRFAELIRERAQRCDVVQIEGQFLLPYVPAIREATRAPIALRAQNVEFRIWEGLGHRLIARSLRKWEIAHLNDCDAFVPISEEDARDFRHLGLTKPSLVVPCGVHTQTSATPADPFAVYFLGSMNYRPNEEAVLWLVERAWPLILALEPRAKLTIAGSSFPSRLRKTLGHFGVALASDVPDIRTFAGSFRAMLAPMLSGSGMRIKVLEAMALGKPVIATPLGAGGIDVTPGENILIGEDAEQFAQHVVHVMHDDALAQRLGDAARALIAARYDPDTLAQTLLAFYEELMERRRDAGVPSAHDHSSPLVERRRPAG